MNIRSLTRGDGAVIGAAVLLLISSFLSFVDVGSELCQNCSANAWSVGSYPTIHLLAIIAAALFVISRMLPEGRKLLGIGFDQWGTVLSVVVGWSALWVLLGANGNVSSFGIGAWLTIVFGLLMAAAGVMNQVVPALKAPLVGAPKPQQPGPYGAQSGYGYPGAQQQPGAFGAQGGYGYPGGTQGGQPQPQPQPAGTQGGQPQPQPQSAGQPAAGGAPEAAFQPFWFAVPVTRPLFGEDGAPQPVAELTPGTWYLAVEQRGQALVAQTQDGRRGVLQDTSGIQRG